VSNFFRNYIRTAVQRADGREDSRGERPVRGRCDDRSRGPGRSGDRVVRRHREHYT